jgi:hypothetical protein
VVRPRVRRVWRPALVWRRGRQRRRADGTVVQSSVWKARAHPAAARAACGAGACGVSALAVRAAAAADETAAAGRAAADTVCVRSGEQ